MSPKIADFPRSGLLENRYLLRLLAGLPRHPDQLNAPFESDAELLPLGSGQTLACTTDSIVEEIEMGLYRDPFLIGWMTVMANLSDLAAVGARPLGLLLVQHLPADLNDQFIHSLQQGISAACQTAETYILGGDTNTSAGLQMGATAIGLIEGGPPLTRRGCQAGDFLYATGPFGQGNAYAFTQLFASDPSPSLVYQPSARLAEGELIRQYATAGIDSSDGFLAAVANLLDGNAVGFQLASRLETLVTGSVRELADRRELPAWIFLAGPHGEFELLFTIPPAREAAFLAAAAAQSWSPLRLGTATEAPGLVCPTENGPQQIDVFRLANLFHEYRDPVDYLQAIIQTEPYEKPQSSR